MSFIMPSYTAANPETVFSACGHQGLLPTKSIARTPSRNVHPHIFEVFFKTTGDLSLCSSYIYPQVPGKLRRNRNHSVSSIWSLNTQPSGCNTGSDCWAANIFEDYTRRWLSLGVTYRCQMSRPKRSEFALAGLGIKAPQDSHNGDHMFSAYRDFYESPLSRTGAHQNGRSWRVSLPDAGAANDPFARELLRDKSWPTQAEKASHLLKGRLLAGEPIVICRPHGWRPPNLTWNGHG